MAGIYQRSLGVLLHWALAEQVLFHVEVARLIYAGIIRYASILKCGGWNPFSSKQSLRNLPRRARLGDSASTVADNIAGNVGGFRNKQ